MLNQQSKHRSFGKVTVIPPDTNTLFRTEPKSHLRHQKTITTLELTAISNKDPEFQGN